MNTRDMTRGRALPHLWAFALPVLLGNWLQLMYNAVDAMLAGQFIGKEALAAEGIAAPVMNLVILGVSGLCTGAGVLMSEHFGAGRLPALRRTLGALMRFGLIASLALVALGWVFSPHLLALLNCPAEIREIAALYLRITFLGAPFTCMYNALAAGLKSAGNTRAPLLFLTCSALLNAGLDLFFLGVLHFGVVCSAVTTVVAEAVSAVLAFTYTRRRVAELCPAAGDLRWDAATTRKLFSYGAPAALQQAIQPIGKVLIQGQVNALGVSAIAAYNAVTRMDDFACIPEQGIAAAVSTWIAQNRGAEKPERVLKGFRAGLMMEIAYGVFIALFAYLLRGPLLRLFVHAEDAVTVAPIGMDYLSLMAWLYVLPALTNCFQGYYRGTARFRVTVLGTLIQVTLRFAFTCLLAPAMGIRGIAAACGIGWSVMLAVIVPYYFVLKRRSRQNA